ncbi:MAG: hypothetical protein CMH22_05495 [Methylophaga sp.]|nr:hypothetical protein [Methylophaga sp.]|tara:strand:- start:138644 stop:139561 length:918 start_codon:yes stop_codon:yes gene_type:complete
MRYKDKKPIEREYYLYRHIRMDTNEPFYIGMGTKVKKYSSLTTEYRRAYDTNRRNKNWKSVVASTDYIVEILYESYDKNVIYKKEKEFIKKYGRKDLNQGSLVNLTNGGEKNKGYVASEETREKQRNSFDIEKHRKHINRISKECFHIKTGKKFKSLKEGCKYFNVTYGSQKEAIRHKRTTALFMFKGEEFEPIKRTHKKYKKCIHIETGEVFKSLKYGCKVKKESYTKQLDVIKLDLSTKKFEFINKEYINNKVKYEVIDKNTGIVYISLRYACEVLDLNYSAEKTKLNKNPENSIFLKREIQR